MRKHASLLLALLLVLALAACASAETLPAETEQTRPSAAELSETKLTIERTEEPAFNNFKSLALTGEVVDQSIFAGHKLTMINIWGTYCNPCISEMPDLAALSGAYEEGEFQVIGMAVDMLDTDGSIHPMAVEAAWMIIDATGADYMHLLPTDDVILMKLQYLTAVPETVFVDSQGNVLTPDIQYLGARSYEEWKAIVDELLIGLPEAIGTAESEISAE